MALEFDELLVKLKEFGKFQKIIYFATGLFSLVTAFNNMGIVFIASVPDHYCAIPELDRFNLSDEAVLNLSIPLETKDGVQRYSQCEMYDRNYSSWTQADIHSALNDPSLVNESTASCSGGWVYDDSIYKSSIVTEWDLVCGDRWLQATSSSIYMAGLLFGVVSMGVVSDTFGRYRTMVVCLVAMVVSTISVAFAPNYTAFVVIRFIVGFFSIAVYTTGFVMEMEIIGPKWRVHAGIANQYFWTVGYIIYAGLAFPMKVWRKLQLVASVPLVALFLTPFVLCESPRWLYAQGRKQEADKVIHKMAKCNHVQLPDDIDVEVKSIGKAYIWDLLRTPRMRMRSLNVFYNWFVNSMVYYGLSLNTSNLGGNDYVNFLMSATVEIPAYLMCHVILTKVGRRWSLCLTMVLGGVALLCTMAVPMDPKLIWISTALAMLGKLFISASFAIIYVFTAELYPTTLRNQALGTGSCFARVGGVVAPYIAQLSDFSRFIPLVTFGAASLVAGLLALFLPETMGKTLPNTIEEGENFGLNKPKNTKDTEEHGMTNPAYEEFTKL